MSSDGSGRRGLRAGSGSVVQPAAGSTPRPNMISDAATPNRLSTESAQAGGALRGTRDSGVGIVVPTAAGTGTRTGTARARLRLPNVGTLIFLGFVGLTAFRIIGDLADRNDAVAPGGTPPATTPGPIAFGTGADGDCGLIGAGVEFDEGADVWWSATLSSMQPPDAAAVVIIRRNGVQIGREDVPADPTYGSWDRLCSSAPVTQHIGGRYRVEVWNGDVTDLLAAGDYVLS